MAIKRALSWKVSEWKTTANRAIVKIRGADNMSLPSSARLTSMDPRLVNRGKHPGLRIVSNREKHLFLALTAKRYRHIASGDLVKLSKLLKDSSIQIRISGYQKVPLVSFLMKYSSARCK
ncbi:hypothetical protein PS15p_211809 [Mucor circinelloides]